MHATTGLPEANIRQGLAEGGHIRNILIVERSVGGRLDYLAYIRPSWRRDFLPLRTWGDRSDRTYRDLDRLLQLLRGEFRFVGCIPLYRAGDPMLGAYTAMRELDLATSLPLSPR